MLHSPDAKWRPTTEQEKSMKIGNKLTVIGTAVLLTVSMGLAQTKKAEPAAATTAKPAKATTHVTTGTVDSITGTGAATTVVIKGAKSTDKPVTLAFDAATTKTGDLVQGAKVSAHYRIDNGKNIATSITVEAAKPAAKTATAAAPAAAPAKK
jgi:ribosomal protein S1